ncbi:MAG TPA: pyridine nucleotide-disulfide oxidoreductase [Parvularcula sp.]|nr:pyridine nucleotide-disulfide oxidoreductase [Parvularcula sp.]
MSGQAVIIGAGQAGAQGAQSLRAAGYEGRIILLGEEPAAPYQRPPLSKAYLQGTLSADRLALKPEAFYAQNGVDLRLGVKAAAIDRKNARVAIEGGEAIAYDRLLLATGAPPRRLHCPGTELTGVHYLRTIADCEGLRPVLAGARRLVIVGAGYIGLEVAASARKAGREVTVLEAQARVLQRVAGPEISAFFESLHRAHGVDLRLGAALSHFEGRGRIERAALMSGETIDCDAALIGVGAMPAIELAKDAGLAIDNGVTTDEHAATSDPAIYAAGDCASHPSKLYGRRMRLESVPNAIEQAKVAAANMAGGSLVYDAVPWFWSDQYDVKLQTAGVAEGADETVVRGDPAAARFTVWSLKEGRVLAVDAVNDPGGFLAAKKIIAAKTPLDAKTLADPATDLKSLAS